MYVARVPNRNSPPAILLREAFREHGKVKNRTLANLSHWPPAQIEALRQVLKGNTTALSSNLPDAFAIVRSLPHGHVAAVLAMIAQLELAQLLERGRLVNFLAGALSWYVTSFLSDSFLHATCRCRALLMTTKQKEWAARPERERPRAGSQLPR